MTKMENVFNIKAATKDVMTKDINTSETKTAKEILKQMNIEDKIFINIYPR